jgi:polyhydroxybutyrate depolymerase
MSVHAQGALAAMLVVAAGAACGGGGPGDRLDEEGTDGQSRAALRAWPDSWDGEAGTQGSLEVGGETRSFYFHRPATPHSEPLPLVIVYHGGFGSPQLIAGQTGFTEVADRSGSAVAYPAAIDHWNDGRDSTARFGDDTSFTSALIDHLVETQGVDRARVYVTGISNGGLMTLRLACERADEIAAFAAVAASFPDTYLSRCRPARSVPILIIHGSDDRLIPEEGATIPAGKIRLAGVFQPLRDTLEFWRKHDRCEQQPTIAHLPDSSDDGTTIQVNEYSRCAPGAEVTFVDIIGGGHTWPGARVNPAGRLAGRVSRDIDGSQLIWEFFRKHTLDGKLASSGSKRNEQHGVAQ